VLAAQQLAEQVAMVGAVVVDLQLALLVELAALQLLLWNGK
jgi:hypothetical protein